MELIIIILLFVKWELIYQHKEKCSGSWSRRPLQWLPASQFCKLWWKAALSESASLWNTLDIKDPYPSPSQFSTILRRTKLAPLDISFPTGNHDPLPPYIIQVLSVATRRIVSLNIPSLAGCHNIFSSPLLALKSLRVLASADSALIANAPFPNIEVLHLGWVHPLPDISQLSSLVDLHFNALLLPPGVTFSDFAHTLSSLPHLKNLLIPHTLPSIPRFLGAAEEHLPLWSLTLLVLCDPDALNVGSFQTWFNFPSNATHFTRGSSSIVEGPNDILTMLHDLSIPLDSPCYQSHIAHANHLHIGFSIPLSMVEISMWNQLPRWVGERTWIRLLQFSLKLDFKQR